MEGVQLENATAVSRHKGAGFGTEDEMMNIGIAADHGGFDLKKRLMIALRE